MSNNTNIKNIQIFLNLRGEPIRKGDICLSTSHGYYAYVSADVNDFVYKLFTEMSIWNGSTDTHQTRDGRHFKQFELDCRDKAFFKSASFKKICQHHYINFVIIEDGEDGNRIMREFWDQMKR